jgi:hypothetical protein
VDAVDYLLNRGAVLVGEARLSLAEVDLVYVGLNLVVTAIETLPERASGPAGGHEAATPPAPPGLSGSLPGVARAARSLAQGLPSPDSQWYAGPAAHEPSAGQTPVHPPADPGERGVEQGLAQLVLTLIELLRQVMERQALRRAEGGNLDDDRLERIGVALMELDGKMDELCALFEIRRDELNLDLGPLGHLLA